jgi:subtilisin family serine protease
MRESILNRFNAVKRLAVVAGALGLVAIVAGVGAAPANALEPPGLQDPAVPGQIIVGVRPGVAVDAVADALGAASVRSLGGGGAFVLEVDDDSVAAAARARRVPGVGFAEPNYIRDLYGPTDADYGLKWDLNNDGTMCSANDPSDCADAGADMNWQAAFDDASLDFSLGATIAVLDTGADPDHPDMKDKLVPGWDYFDNDDDPADDYGHGMHVAGIAAAETNNLAGTAGVAWSANITVMPLKVCGWIQTLFGDVYGCPDDAIISAINHAINNGADVINMSLGGGSRSKAQENAINDAWNAGLAIVVASGNDGSDAKVSYPAAYPNSIAVGATDWNDVRSPYSNGGNALDVVAPGGRMVYYHDLGGIYSTMPTYPVYLTTELSYSQGYDQLQGTSMSSPQVAGLAALLFAQGHANTDVRALIESTADDLGAAGWDKIYGHGRVNVLAALSGTVAPPPPPEPEPDPTPTGDVAVAGITPFAMDAGTTIDVTVTGSGFLPGATLTFEGGKGSKPTAAGVQVAVDGLSLTASVSANPKGKSGAFVLDVVVTNPDLSTGTLSGAFTLTR